MEKWILLLVGGMAGTASRYGLDGFVTQRMGAAFPWGTLAVNTVGCFVVGFLDVLLEKKFLLHPGNRLLLVTGFCGAFTTFSTLMMETAGFMKANQFLHAFGNIFMSVGLGLVVFRLGMMVAEAV